MVSRRQRTGRASALTTILIVVLGLMAAACGSSTVDDEAATDGDGTDQVDDGTATGRTIREEAPTTTDTTVPTTAADLGPLPDAEWVDVEFELLPIADTEAALAMTTRTGTDDLWIVEREGRVRVIQRRVSLDDENESIKLLNTVVLDITDKVSTEGEGGLLGLAFSTNGRLLYVSYTDNDGNSVIAEYRMDLLTALPDSERILLTVEQPFPNHNGGQITLGPDGFLYVALGDGGSGGDPLGSGQDTSTLLGSLLRIDPVEQTDDLPYRVPDDNPFTGRREQRDEIWAYGLRNPWRFSFDHRTGDLWIGDVGQGLWEEINYLPSGPGGAGSGANLGWNIFEGDQPYEDADTPDDRAEPSDHVPPVHVYGHENGRCSVTGGYVYRGRGIEALQGVYLFADYCTGELFGLERLDDGRLLYSPITVRGGLGQVVSFGQGPEQELYILEADGTVSRLQIRDWDRDVQVYGPDEAIPAGGFQVDLTPGPDDPVINNPDPEPVPEPDGSTTTSTRPEVDQDTDDNT